MPENAAKPWREEVIAGLTGGTLDLLVIGGGIVGAGVARDAAMRGIHTALIEQFDFAAGTSSRSSRLLHGGLRYLAQGHLSLVRESSVEKRILQQIAPHLALPLAFVFPTYKDRPAWKRWKLGIGVKIYDALCGWKNFGSSSSLSPANIQRIMPGIRADALTGGVRYFDGFTNDARLVIDTLRSARRHGAAVCSHLKLIGATRENNTWRCEISDEESKTTLTVRATSVISACGPWAQGAPNSAIPLRLTKGVHIVVDCQKLPVTQALVMTEGKRILFALPWGLRTIIGTTDTDYAGKPEDVRCEPADVEYLLRIVNEYFPHRKLEPADVRAAWAGVRPLVADNKKQTFETSRSHVMRQTAENWFEIAGGKLTTYRLMAEQAVLALPFQGRRKYPRGLTANSPLIEPGEPDGIGVIPPAVAREVVEHFCDHEWALHLGDIMFRRAGWHYYVNDPLETAGQVATWMAELLNWPADRIDDEITAYQREISPVYPNG